MQFFVIPNGQLEMPWNNTLFLVIAGGITSQLKDLSGQVLQNGSEINYACNNLGQCFTMDIQVSHTWGTSTNTLGIVALLQETVNTANGEL